MEQILPRRRKEKRLSHGVEHGDQVRQRIIELEKNHVTTTTSDNTTALIDGTPTHGGDVGSENQSAVLLFVALRRQIRTRLHQHLLHCELLRMPSFQSAPFSTKKGNHRWRFLSSEFIVERHLLLKYSPIN